MISTLVKLSILVLCVTFVSSAPVEEKKRGFPGGLKNEGKFFKNSGGWMTGKNKKPSVTVEKQAENVVMAERETLEKADELDRQGKDLQTFAFTLEAIEESERENSDQKQKGFWKKLVSAIHRLARLTIKMADVITERHKDIKMALIESTMEVEDIVKKSMADIGEAVEEIDQRLAETEIALYKLDTIGSGKVERISQELDETAELILQASKALRDVGEYSTALDQKVDHSGRRIADVLNKARARIGSSVTTG